MIGSPSHDENDKKIIYNTSTVVLLPYPYPIIYMPYIIIYMSAGVY